MNVKVITEELDNLLNDICELIGEGDKRSIRTWLAAATLRIWSGNELLSDGYSEAMSVLLEKEPTKAQILTAMNCSSEEGRSIVVPEFFCEIVSRDLENNMSKSRLIADSIGRFLASMALINDDFTIQEAILLKEISDTLISYCDWNGVIAGKVREDIPSMITDLNKSRYYQLSDKKEPDKKEKAISKDDRKNGSAANKNTSESGETNNPDDASILNLGSLLDEIIKSNVGSDTPETQIGVSVEKAENKSEKNKKESVESILAELDSLVGLENVKKDVHSLMNFIKVCQMRANRGLMVPTVSYHLVFTGNPGTGKTTVARMVAKLYYNMGLLSEGQLVETDRSGLVAGYLGQTAIKTQKVIQQALGGVLFIDEAYSLANDKEDSYGKEAIETLLKAMEDHRDELVVIVAGYSELMHKFIDSNPGLRSRFNKYFDFPDYNGAELLLILQSFCKKNGYKLSEEAVPYLKEKLDEMFENREEHFGNARAVRNLFEHAINNQANRIVTLTDITDEQLSELALDDIVRAMEVM